MAEALTQYEVNDLVYRWYKKLDVHAPVDEVTPLLISEDVKMVFPEATLHGIEEFKGWYEKVTNLFFDEIHTMKMLNIDLQGDVANVKLVVNWQAKIWNPPAAKSTWLGFDAIQTWTIKRDPVTGKAAIAVYVVDALDKMEGSADL